MSLTDLDVKKQMRRLAAVYHPPDDKEAAISVWRHVLDDLTPTELMRAVGEYLKSDARYFPKPGAIRQMAMRRRTGPSPTETKRNGPDPALQCPACKAKLRELEPDEQVLVVYDHDRGGVRNLLRESDSGSKRFGIFHDLSVPHDGLPVTYGREGMKSV